MESEAAINKTEVDAKTFICPNCGGSIKYDISSSEFLCSSCRTKYEAETLSETVKEYDFSDYAERESRVTPFEGLAVVRCQNCGCEITFDRQQVSAVCPMCSSTQVAEVKQAAGIPPEGIIPFEIDKDEASQRFKKWVKSRLFAPGNFKKSCAEGALKGMYLPFWTYDTDSVGFYTGRGGKDRTVKGKDGKTHTETDWYPVSGVVSETFNDIQVCASEKEAIINGILPFNTVEKTVPYSPSYLSGFYAELYKLKADKGFTYAQTIIENRLTALAEHDILSRYDKADVNGINIKNENVTYKHVLLPVWSSVYSYAGKLYHYFINGETGKVSGLRPYSPLKIVLTVVGAVIVLFGIYVAVTNR